MSFFLKLLRSLLCCGEDERDHEYGSYNQLRTQTIYNEYKPSQRNHWPPPLTYSINPSPASIKPTPSKPVLSVSPFSPSSPSPKPPASSSKVQRYSSIYPSSTFLKLPIPSKPPQSSYVDTGSTLRKPPSSLSKIQQSCSVDPYSTFPKPPPSSSSLNPPNVSSKHPQSPPLSKSSFSPVFPTACDLKTPNLLSSNVGQRSRILSPPKSSSEQPQLTSAIPASSLSKLSISLSQVEKSSSAYPYSASPKPPTSSSKPSHSSSLPPRPPTPSLKSSPFSPKISSNSKQPQASSKPHRSSRKSQRSSSKPSASSPPNQKGKKYNNWVPKSSLPIYAIPEDIKYLLKSDFAPDVLNKPLSPTTYRDYFTALLYAEDFYHEKWPHFDVKNVTLSIHKASVHKNTEEDKKIFVEFDMASFPEDRPLLLSRDFIYVRPSGTKVEHFEGIINRIVRSSTIVVEFKDDFYYHEPSREYDVSFSFNRVCLKRAHQAVRTASKALIQNFLFPDCVSRTSVSTAPALLPRCHKLDLDQLSAVRHILSIKGSPPYLVSGHLWVERNVFRKSRTGEVVSEAVYQLCQTSAENRILICASTNRRCDGLMRLLKGIPESDMFRANAAFREIDDVPEDILPSCLYEDPYFSCPPIEKLRKFRVIVSTFMSSFRLHDKGLIAGHFSHIFLVDASSAIEPETLVPLTNFADKDTTVIVTGAREDRSKWVRSDIARKKGLRISYFERLFKSLPYRSLNPKFITQLNQQKHGS